VGFLHFKRMHVEQKELNEVWENDRIVPDNINLLFTERNGYTEEYWPEVVIPLEFPIVTFLGIDMDSF